MISVSPKPLSQTFTSRPPAERLHKPPLAAYMIQTEGLTRRFGRVAAVDNLELTVPLGSIYGFLGPNGAGKTTTIRMLLGLIRPTAGRVRLFGQPLEGNAIDLLARTGSLVETPAVYPHLIGWWRTGGDPLAGDGGGGHGAGSGRPEDVLAGGGHVLPA